MSNGTCHNVALSGYFYPTTVALVSEQDHQFLNKLCLTLNKELIYRLFIDAETTWRYIANKRQGHQLHHENLLLNVLYRGNRLSNSLFYYERFNEISVIILDLSSLTFNQLIFIDNLYQKLSWPYPKIIGLTLKPSKQRFVYELLKQKRIHRVLLKNDPHFTKKINQAILELQQEYFENICAPTMHQLCTSDLSYLTDPIFVHEFQKICRSNKVSEYYFYENTGGFLLINTHGKLNFLIIRTEQKLASQKIKWKNHHYAAKIIKGEQPYWYSIIKAEACLDYSLHHKIFSYREYIRKIWPPLS